MDRDVASLTGNVLWEDDEESSVRNMELAGRPVQVSRALLEIPAWSLEGPELEVVSS